jgi:hypothetical protein
MTYCIKSIGRDPACEICHEVYHNRWYVADAI